MVWPGHDPRCWHPAWLSSGDTGVYSSLWPFLKKYILVLRYLNIIVLDTYRQNIAPFSFLTALTKHTTLMTLHGVATLLVILSIVLSNSRSCVAWNDDTNII
jgi:hypothetical protein